MTNLPQGERLAVACRHAGKRFALVGLIWVLAFGLVVQCPAFTTLVGSPLARAMPASGQSSEEERPAESSETPAVQTMVSQGRKAARVLTTSPSALRMPLLNASGCMAARHHDGGRMLVCDARLGTGLPLRL